MSYFKCIYSEILQYSTEVLSCIILKFVVSALEQVQFQPCMSSTTKLIIKSVIIHEANLPIFKVSANSISWNNWNNIR
jgi:hypothetical protein